MAKASARVSVFKPVKSVCVRAEGSLGNSVPASKPKPKLKASEVQEQLRIDPETLDVLSQVRLTFSRKNILGACVGFLFGGFPSFASWWLVHEELNLFDTDWNTKKILLSAVVSVIVLGCLLFSANTVYEFGKRFFHGKAKAFGYCILIEGVLTFSGTFGLGIAALGFLVVMNGIATAVNLICKKPETQNDSGGLY